MSRDPIPRHRMRPGQCRWFLVGLILVAFVLRVYNLGGPELWFDEAISANISALGWVGALAHVRAEPFEHPPVYYLSLYPWQRLTGTSEFALRFFSVFWGVLYLPLLYVLVKRLANAALAQLAMLLATFSPFLVAYSQETRMYTLLPCLALLLLLSFNRALQRGDRPGWWLVYGVLLAVGIATQYFFALLWLATMVYLILEWRKRREVWRWAVAVQALVMFGAAIWLIAAPGLRASLARVAQGEAAFSLGYKLSNLLPSLLVGDAGSDKNLLVFSLLAAVGWLLILLGVWWSKRARMLSLSSWRLLLLCLVVPLVSSLLIPYGVLGRHLGYTLMAGFPFMALGLMALRRPGWIGLAGGILVILLLSTFGLATQYTIRKGDFGQAIKYINEHGQAGDLLVLTQPAQRPLVDYYNRKSWPVQYLPEQGVSLTPALVEQELNAIAQTHSRLWLGPIGAWTADSESLVERWLVGNTFQADKAWFPESSSSALYFTVSQKLRPIEIGALTWGGHVRLEALRTGSLRVRPGDALRLRFQWRAIANLEERYVVDLRLLDSEGRVWAERRSEPCGGWCPTDIWRAGQREKDLHALLIPPGTPPGRYELETAWLPLNGGSALMVEEDGLSVGRAILARVDILSHPAGDGVPQWLPNPLQATFGGEVTLLGYQPLAVEARPADNVHLETYWRAETRPSAEYVLLVELIDGRGRAVASWPTAPSTALYPTSQWRPGEFVRGQQNLPLPNTLPPGHYRLRLALASPTGEHLTLRGEIYRGTTERLESRDLVLASVRILDRPRRFKLPRIPHALDAIVGQQAHLLGYDLDVSQAHPGGQVGVTLYWQASGPMPKPYKVFTHLVDADGTIRAQHDAPPGGGCCPTNTWSQGEIIADEHAIPVAADIVPGTYDLVVGLYDEPTNTRLPAVDSSGNRSPGDRIVVSSVPVKPLLAPPGQEQTRATPPATVPYRPEFEGSHSVFLPVVSKGEP